MQLFVEYPTWIKPELFSSLPIRWYSLMYLVAFAITFLLYYYQIRRKEIDSNLDDAINLFLYAIVGLILGARLFSALIYEGSWYYWKHPHLIFWPFKEGHFVGLPGMSYHGGLIGTILGIALYCRQTKSSFLEVSDALTAAIPLGYTFGRLGNFINGELWGRVTTVRWGMIFPSAPRYSTSYEWVRNIADAIGLPYGTGELLNLPRHPSQLYEALGEGILLWLFLWFVIRKRKKYPGYVSGWYLIGYSVVRFFIEYLREPDSNLGFIIAWGKQGPSEALFSSLLNISMGQIFSLIMLLSGVLLLYFAKRRPRVARS